MIIMEISLVDTQIIFSYEEDGSKWIFWNFFRQVGKYYLLLIPFQYASKSLESAPKFRVPLTREEYVLIKTEIVELTNYPKHSKFKRRKEIPLDSFVDRQIPVDSRTLNASKDVDKLMEL